MMMHRIVGTSVLTLALVGVAACDLPPKEVGSTLGTTDGDSATSEASTGGSGGGQSNTSAAESATSTTGGSASASTSGSSGDNSDEGTLSDGTPLDVGGTTDDGGGQAGDECDPLVQNCPDGSGCYLDGVTFSCQLDVSGDAGASGDACSDIAGCDPGLVCVSCGLGDCCAQICDTSEGGCPTEQGCSSVYADGTAPPGLENVGVCG